MIDIRRYTEADKAAWDAFVAQSKNGTFLFFRDYMDYHADRFCDHSLMIYVDGRLYALMPANKTNGVFYSHQGLTYGGLVMSQRCKAAQVRDIFVSLVDYLRGQGFSRVVYKHVPWVYAKLPAEEDLFALSNVCRASLLSRDVASVVMLDRRLPFSTLRRRGVKKGLQAGLCVREQTDFTLYWRMLELHLGQKFQAKPVHSLDEIMLLKRRFPNNIRLMTVCKDDVVLGGTLLYDCGQTVKTQYIVASEEGRQHGALDFLFDKLLDYYAAEKRQFFDFGTSNLPENDDLNDSLIFQKEGFGGRAVCYDSYEWKL
jgi:hypothetical protein